MQSGMIIDNRYQIIKEIGKGGGGVVYLADHLSLKQQVVLKQIRHADSYSDQESLRNEVDILKRLKHPALPQVYDFLKIDGLVFTAMEYIPGYSLQEYMNGGTVFPQEIVLKWARQLADVLEYMHTRQQPVIHRDIKPSNIMLKPDWSVTLIDFNISDDKATSYGVSGYSKGFASPEQLEKGRLMEHRIPSKHIIIDAPSDIYSLGAVLYYLLCGEKPAQPYISLESRNCCVYPLARIVDKCLQKEKKDRYQTATELKDALNHLEKTDCQFLKYAWIQRLSITMSIFLLAVGICLIFFGRTVMVREAFIKEYDDFKQAVENKSDDIGVRIDRILRNPKWAAYVDNDVEKAETLYYQQARYYAGFNPENAFKAFDKALALNNKNEQIYSDYIQCCLRHDRPGQARKIMKKAENSGISSGQMKLWNGKIYLADEAYTSAIQIFGELIEGEAGKDIRDEAMTFYAKACIELQDYDKAEKILDQKENKETADYLNLSLIYEHNKLEDKCREALIMASQSDPENPEIYVRLGLHYYYRDDIEKARTYYNLAKGYKKGTGESAYSKEFEDDFQELESLID